MATRNIDGVVYTIVSAGDKITVLDRVNRVEYDAVVGEKDNRIAIVLESARSLPGPPSFTQLQSILKATSPGAEALNGRVAMVAFLGIAGVELATGQPLLAQLTTGAGAAAAAAVAVLTMSRPMPCSRTPRTPLPTVSCPSTSLPLRRPSTGGRR